MFEHDFKLNFLMPLALYLDIQLIIFLELLSDLLLPPLHLQLYFVFVRVWSASRPADIFDEVVLRNINGGASES